MKRDGKQQPKAESGARTAGAPRGATLEQIRRFMETADAEAVEGILEAARRRADGLVLVDDLTAPRGQPPVR